MRRSSRRPARLTATLTAAATLLAGSVASVGLAGPAQSRAAAPAPLASAAQAQATPAQAPAPALRAGRRNKVTPGNFTGYGFDQCVAPSQRSMNRWLNHSPFLAAGIYISGKSRGCRSQPNLTPRWVSTQLRKGWRLLPITLGPQAWCHPSFPRYSDDVDINRDPGNRYGKARRQGRREAASAIDAARRLGIARGSTLWYDLEGFDLGITSCRESSLAFLSGWSWKLKREGWVSGVYSSAGSGIKMLDDARRFRSDQFVLPRYLWIARWDGRANTSTTYISEAGWNPHRRVKQYRGDHYETHGGVTINIDSNFLDVGRGSYAPDQSYCGGTRITFRRYRALRPGGTNPEKQVRALQCLLDQRGFYDGKLDGRYDRATRAAANRWRAERGLAASAIFTRAHWVSIHATGRRATLKIGSAGGAVRRLQRALNAGGHRAGGAKGVFGAADRDALRRWQASVGYPRTGVMSRRMWGRMAAGRF